MTRISEGGAEEPIPGQHHYYFNARSLKAAIAESGVEEERRDLLLAALKGAYADIPLFRGYYDLDTMLKGVASIDASEDEKQVLTIAIMKKAVDLKRKRKS